MSVDVLGFVLRFADPVILGLLLAVPALVALAVRRQRRRGDGLLFSSIGLLPSPRRPWRARLRPFLPAVRVAAIVLVIVALARPQMVRASEIPAQGIDIAITLDVSGSMSSPDFGNGQTRIGAVKRVVHDFVGALTNDRVGLVVFGSESLVLSPLTLDHAVVQKMADPLQPDGRLVGGATAIGTGLATALNVLRDSAARSKVVILLTDGENNTGTITPLDAAKAAKLLGVRVYTIGAVPADERQRGTVEVDEQLMKEMAETTGGRYFAASDESALRQIYAEIAQLERSRVGLRTENASYEDVMAPFLLGGVLLLLLEGLASLTVLRRAP
ncbi:MAG: VWA domain-containing protein [Chloroflexota bacterium]|nr:VWA domain-containing protein [Chloroflexota bacterium]MDE3192113.1 VWA domain-containing protein [Chloroflexota bacterium]